MLNWHKSPIYQNGCFYDRYIEIKVPSAYHLSLTNNITLQVNNPYGFSGKIGKYDPYDPTTYNLQDYIIYNLDGIDYKLPKFTDERFIFYYKNGNYGKLPQYVLPTTDPKSREITYTVLPDP